MKLKKRMMNTIIIIFAIALFGSCTRKENIEVPQYNDYEVYADMKIAVMEQKKVESKNFTFEICIDGNGTFEDKLNIVTILEYTGEEPGILEMGAVSGIILIKNDKGELIDDIGINDLLRIHEVTKGNRYFEFHKVVDLEVGTYTVLAQTSEFILNDEKESGDDEDVLIETNTPGRTWSKLVIKNIKLEIESYRPEFDRYY